MNNNIDLTEERVFRDNKEKSDFHKVPWKSDIIPDSKLNELLEFDDIEITSNNSNNIITFNNSDRYILQWNTVYDTIDYDIDEYIEFEKSKYSKNNYCEKDIFGCDIEYNIMKNYHHLPWKKEYKDTKDVVVSSSLIEKDLKDHTCNYLFHTPKEKQDICGFVENMIDSGDLYQFHKDLLPFRKHIPWEYMDGEKNPLNTWNLEEDFEDKNIEMPTDSFFLRNPGHQQVVQLSLN